LDRDLAALYGIPAIRFNEAVKRDRRCFPNEFTFRLTTEDLASLISQIAMSKAERGEPGGFNGKHDPALACLTLRYGLWQTDER